MLATRAFLVSRALGCAGRAVLLAAALVAFAAPSAGAKDCGERPRGKNPTDAELSQLDQVLARADRERARGRLQRAIRYYRLVRDRRADAPQGKRAARALGPFLVFLWWCISGTPWLVSSGFRWPSACSCVVAHAQRDG